MKKFFSKLIIPLGWTIVMQILLCLPGNNLPSSDLFEIPEFDKYVHVFLFGTFVILWCYYLNVRVSNRKRLNLLFFFVFLFAAFNGIIIEYIQVHFIPLRSFDEGDIISDLMGAGVAYGICNVKFLTC